MESSSSSSSADAAGDLHHHWSTTVRTGTSGGVMISLQERQQVQIRNVLCGTNAGGGGGGCVREWGQEDDGPSMILTIRTRELHGGGGGDAKGYSGGSKKFVVCRMRPHSQDISLDIRIQGPCQALLEIASSSSSSSSSSLAALDHLLVSGLRHSFASMVFSPPSTSLCTSFSHDFPPIARPVPHTPSSFQTSCPPPRRLPPSEQHRHNSNKSPQSHLQPRHSILPPAPNSHESPALHGCQPSARLHVQNGYFDLDVQPIEPSSDLSTPPSPNTSSTAVATPPPPAPAPKAAKGATQRRVDGVQIREFSTGDGAVAKRGEKVRLKYVGKLVDGDGREFDRGTITFTLGAGEVVAGLDAGVEGMRVGGSRLVAFPARLGYGKEGAGGVVPPGAALRFWVELLRVGAREKRAREGEMPLPKDMMRKVGGGSGGQSTGGEARKGKKGGGGGRGRAEDGGGRGYPASHQGKRRKNHQNSNPRRSKSTIPGTVEF